jgi:alpha-mannosidase
MPCPRGWRADGVVAAAQRLREPLWCRPQASPSPIDGVADLAPLLPALPDDLELISLRADGRDGEPRAVQMAVQNLGPCRRRLAAPPGWRLLERVDGLGRALDSHDLCLRPWQLGFWRLAPTDHAG